MKYYWLYLLISGLIIVPGILSLMFWGIKPSIDFTGGSLLELTVTPKEGTTFDKARLLQLSAENGIQVASINDEGQNTYLLRAAPFSQEKSTEFKDKIASASAATITEKRFETLGPTMGGETLKKALIALAIATTAILLFVWKQFKDKKFGVCAVLAMLHDSLLVFGAFSILGHFYNVEIDTLFMTAVLTVLSFSIHDTIIVYDRIRESMHKLPNVPFPAIANKAINETLGRSVNNSMTIIFMLLCLYLLGGETVRWFVFALLIGTISGAYSSPFTAVPFLIVWDKWIGKKR